MARYLVQANYSSDAWRALVDRPHDRAEPVRTLVEQVGGRLECFYFSFGEFDVVAIVDLPDNMTAAAVLMRVAAGQAVEGLHTTPLITLDESIEALTRAQTLEYRPPEPIADLQTPIYAG